MQNIEERRKYKVGWFELELIDCGGQEKKKEAASSAYYEMFNRWKFLLMNEIRLVIWKQRGKNQHKIVLNPLTHNQVHAASSESNDCKYGDRPENETKIHGASFGEITKPMQ